MKLWQIVLLGVLGLCALGLTNPDPGAYEVYAIEQIGNLAKDQCTQAPAGLGILIQGPCRAAVEAYKPQLRPLLATTTTRQNFILFSIYRSDISIPAANFNAKVESIGIGNHFLIYKAP
jgi:Domain of unknown function (DUF4359)